MPISSIMQGAMSALLTNQTALRVTADNIGNVHTPGYGRREAVQQPAMAGNAVAGVEVAQIRRAADRFLDGAARTASADAAKYGAMADLHGRIQAMLGAPGGETSLSARIETVLSGFGTLALDPSAPARLRPGLRAQRSRAGERTQSGCDRPQGGRCPWLRRRTDHDPAPGRPAGSDRGSNVHDDRRRQLR